MESTSSICIRIEIPWEEKFDEDDEPFVWTTFFALTPPPPPGFDGMVFFLDGEVVMVWDLSKIIRRMDIVEGARDNSGGMCFAFK